MDIDPTGGIRGLHPIRLVPRLQCRLLRRQALCRGKSLPSTVRAEVIVIVADDSPRLEDRTPPSPRSHHERASGIGTRPAMVTRSLVDE